MTVRTVAAGLLLAAYLIQHFAVSFSQWVVGSSPQAAFYLALSTLAPQVAHVSGAEWYLPVAYIIGCLGVGLAVSGVIWPLIECLFSHIYAAVQRKRNKRIETEERSCTDAL